jgi:hypothetical protein
VSESVQSGDTANQRQFVRPKGFAGLSWQSTDRLKLITWIERAIGQLDFDDFVSSVDLALDAGNAGNSEIVPPQHSVISLQAEQALGAWGAVIAKVGYEALEDVVDRVPIGTFDGPCNLDSGEGAFLEFDMTLKLDWLGLREVGLSGDGSCLASRVRDPVTRRERAISGEMRGRAFIELRHDMPSAPWAWGTNIERVALTEELTLNERRLEKQAGGLAEVFIEHKDLFGLMGRLTLLHVLDILGGHERTVFTPDRRSEPIRSDVSWRERGPI